MERRTVTRTATMSWLVWLVWLAWLAPIADACSVCFGNGDPQLRQGIEASVLFMVAVTYGLIVAGGLAFARRRFRARSMSDGGAR